MPRGPGRVPPAEHLAQLFRRLVVDAHLPLLPRRGKLGAVVDVVEAEELVVLLGDLVKPLPGRRMPMNHTAICTRRDQNVLRLAQGLLWPPSHQRRGQGVTTPFVQDERA